MGGWWWVGLVGIALFAWTVVLDVRWGFEERLARWCVAKARDEGRFAGAISFVRSAVLLGAYVAVALLGHHAGAALGHPYWALVLSGPAMLAYAPVVLAMAPTQGGAYGPWRRQLAEAGADSREQRAIAWCAGPPAFCGMLAVIVTLVTVFAI